ncbi:MAG: hypothetical protein BGP11_19285 [Rhodobacterales bacterium 65-51]|uniref:6-hydroxymethylpterin diphosphokinase MptE-like protein n=1 Tax=uncultured Gemmobacter sp. TaxID=1095917 RepID=UPI00095A355F|nr:6-hydroxymethylpterin diphosphokinase MptE-like protein [uncultured Gemmobacter sp.]OJY28917.1 MAG: hypothetical protein BGP11_19285 [Rhodobacterales bacterium 65-51]
MKKILLLTDSRGVHKPAGSTHQIYAERLAKTPGIKLTSFRCPFQWTTTLDLLQILEQQGAANFDHVILHSGIVDHSPRGLSSMMTRLVDPADATPAEEVERLVASRDFSKKKIVNRKRPLLEAMFGKAAVDTHFATPFTQKYEGEQTINLYSLDMLKQSLLPRLRQIPNLIFISSNTFSRGWEGDYPKPRPENIYMIEDYSRALCEGLDQVVNLHQWNDAQVRRFTCDNLHLTKEGSDWIYLRLMETMGLRKRDFFENRRSIWTPADNPTPWPLSGVEDITALAGIRLTQQKQLNTADVDALRRKHSLGDGPLATLVIGFRFGDDDDTSRQDNMRHLVQYLQTTYPGAFDILLVEQDKTRRFRPEGVFAACRYAFLYNPNAYNRGWLYNVAAKHYTKAPVVGFLDTDVIPGANFLDCVLDCVKDFDIISPNRSLFYATTEQTEEFRRTGRFEQFPVTEANIKNPTTLAGGMLVVNREAFLSIGGFEQYVGYGCEDRALDVTMFALLPLNRIRMDSQAYFHQYHPIVESERAYFRDIYNHMAEHYACEYSPGLGVTDYIHKNCNHAGHAKVTELRDLRIPHVGDPDLYRDNGNLTVNGLPGRLDTGIKLVRVEKTEPVFPPECDGVKPYNDSEELTGRFANAWAPAVKRELAVDDTRQMQFFYNRFKGKRCFIIGNGPSLNQHDLSLLKNEYTFAVNSFYYKTRETGFAPTFFVVEDSSVIKENQEEIVNFETPFKFFPTIYQSLHPKKPGTYFFPLNRGFYDKFSPNYAIPRFSTDVSKVAYCGQSVTYVNLQLAYYMGFTEVYLIGMDFNYVIPDSHSRNGDVLTSDTDDPNHFHKDYFGKGKTWKDPKLDRVLMNYKMAKLVYECAGRQIFNATKGGHLEEFERVNYDGLFGGIDRRFRQEPLDLTRPDAAWSKLRYPPATETGEVKAPVVASRPPAQPSQPSPHEVLRKASALLLLDPAAKTDEAAIAKALSALPKNDPLAVHFQRVRTLVTQKG